MLLEKPRELCLSNIIFLQVLLTRVLPLEKSYVLSILCEFLPHIQDALTTQYKSTFTPHCRLFKSRVLNSAFAVSPQRSRDGPAGMSGAGKTAASMMAARLKTACSPSVLCLIGRFSSALGPDLIINHTPHAYIHTHSFRGRSNGRLTSLLRLHERTSR